MTVANEPRSLSGKLVVGVLILISIGLIVLTAVLTWGKIDTTAKPVDSPISDRPLVVGE